MIKRIQHLLQWLFMRVEALFNKAFGDHLNPLYHLGEMTFFLFWIVAASGLYLYAFFETGVADAYGSVESLTHNQWFAGGIMRSVHRYASDAMSLTMILHLLRHFAFDRFRGFRWFSWLTGIFLLWMVYASGINGFMLPWDKLAQFVTVATFEWLDWLPIFDGALIRNFIYQSSVSDRFFSLLAFMHIGLPLAVLLLMWVHVQRVPKAKTQPPRPISYALAITLLLLSLVLPVYSQGGAADFGVAPLSLKFDWFYLPVFPLLYAWPLAKVWALLGGLTLLFVALPWLPPKFSRRKKTEFHMTVHPDQRTLKVRTGETILEAGLREGLALPFECRNGGCGKCQCTVLNGNVEHGIYQRSALSDGEKALGKTLMCCATPLSDLEIEYEPTGEVAEIGIHHGVVTEMERLAPEVMRLKVSLPEEKQINFVAGQYINILLPDGQRRAFSFANPPHENRQIELHVRLIPGGLFTTQVFNDMKVGDEMRFEGPLGSFSLNDSERPILFVAGATGFAPIKSIIEDAFRRNIRRQMLLYWGVRKREDLYMLELTQRWQQEHQNFKIIPVLSEAQPQDQWQGRQGLVHQAIMEDFPDLSGKEVYVCGSLRLVEAAFPAFIAQGLSEDACFSDAFVPSAQSKEKTS